MITKIPSQDTNVGARLFFFTLSRFYLTGRCISKSELHLHGRAFGNTMRGAFPKGKTLEKSPPLFEMQQQVRSDKNKLGRKNKSETNICIKGSHFQ